jgi:hypothetical protein
MAFASVGTRTPFFIRVPSNAAKLVSLPLEAGLRLGLGLGLGFAAAGATAALLVLAAFSLAGFVSLFAAITGTAAMAKMIRCDSHFFRVNINFAFNIRWCLLPVGHFSMYQHMVGNPVSFSETTL